jgi:hypothetical protein
MENFSLLGADFEYKHYNPQQDAKYGLGIGFWHSNMNELLFTLQYINKHWVNRHKIDISICSYADVRPDWYEEIKSYTNYIVRPLLDHGKERGTMYQMNGAFYPLWQNPTVETLTHTDADEIIINAQYFFGLANMLLDSDKSVLGASTQWTYDMATMTDERLYQHCTTDIYWEKFLQSFIILNKKKIKFGAVYPFQGDKSFHKDLWKHVENSGITEKDLLLIKRHDWNRDIPTNFLYAIDLHMGILRSANRLEYPETEDRKIKLLKFMTTPIWDNIPEGWAYYWVTTTPDRDNYVPTTQPPYEGYPPKLPPARPNKLR